MAERLCDPDFGFFPIIREIQWVVGGPGLSLFLPGFKDRDFRYFLFFWFCYIPGIPSTCES